MSLFLKISSIGSSVKRLVFPFFSPFLIYFPIIFTIPNNISGDIHFPRNLNYTNLNSFNNLKKEQNQSVTFKKKSISVNKLQSPPKINKNKVDQSLSKFYFSYLEKMNHLDFNEKMRRIIISFLQFEVISRKRFNRGAKRLSTQAEFEDLADHIIESRWFREVIKRISSNHAYGFSEERLIRVLFSIQVASSSYDIPYPALFCLFFQESKFDFLANSHTGAKGIGQLTSIGIKEVSRLRNNKEKESLLQKTATHLNQVYNDPQINLWLEKLGFKIKLPKIKPIPKKIEFTRINSAFIREVGLELVKRGHSYGKNIGLLWYLSKKIRRGRILSERYAHTHKIFSEMLAKRYASSPSSAYNIETNILASTILFDHYYRYRWKEGKEMFNLPEDTRVILAASAYNHGQSGMRRFLINLKQEFPSLNFRDLTAKRLKYLFTSVRLKKAVQRPDYKISETSTHINKIMECSSKRTKFQNNSVNNI